MRSLFRSSTIWSVVLGAALLGWSGCAKQPAPSGQSPAPGLRVPAAEDKRTVVASVNGAGITRYELIDMMNRLSALNQRVAPAPDEESIKKRALDQLILQELALQEAERQGMHADPAVIDRTMDQYIARLGHEAGFREYLDQQHLTTVEFRQQVERSILIQLILTKEVLAKAAVSEDDARAAYEREKDRYMTPERQKTFDEARSSIEARLRAEAQLKRRQEWEKELKINAKIELFEPDRDGQGGGRP
ncbi:MAG: SurA N-terminal domain-containing protein [Nitrospiraceae bacterium]|nr:SurA N-terminal domain-containing protein [Nitrospiraceae bacterium]